MKRYKRYSSAAIAAALLAAASASTAFCAEGGEYSLTSLTPLTCHMSGSMSQWGERNNTSFIQVSGGNHASVHSDSPASRDNLGRVAYRLMSSSFGMQVTEQLPDFTIGGYCTYLPVDDPERIDWEATFSNIRGSESYAQGYVYYFPNQTNAYERIIFTRTGSAAIDWVVKAEVGNATTTERRAYTIGANTATRPFRIFWTEKPFNAPKIDMTGKFVSLLGAPEIVKPEYSFISYTDSGVVVTNILRGVVFDPDSSCLRAYAKCTDPDEHTFDGPTGQFVLAYYDSGMKDDLLCTIVVEVSGPDVNVIESFVGDELRPIGGGYDIDLLTPIIQKGDAMIAGDNYSPYLYKYQSSVEGNGKKSAVYAIVPTDATTTADGRDAPWRADIYWEAPDPQQVLWPFEEDYYLVRWNPKSQRVLTCPEGMAQGAPVKIPTDYTATLCAYSDPAGIASLASTNLVSVSAPGFFMIRLLRDDNVWFLPMHATRSDDAAHFSGTAREWYVGDEIRMRGGAVSDASEELVMQADASHFGYIYEPASEGRNWNPRLYHPNLANTSQVGSADGSGSADPYGDLESAIYAVNTSQHPIEVWWYSQLCLEDGAKPIEIPILPQKYRAIWPDARDAHEIVIASQRGSDYPCYVTSGSALYIGSEEMSADTTAFRLGSAEGLTIGFWAIKSPRAASAPQCAGGSLLEFRSSGTNSVFRSQLEGDMTLASSLIVGANGDEPEDVEVSRTQLPDNEWKYFVYTFEPENPEETNTAWRITAYVNGQTNGSPVTVSSVGDFSGADFRLRVGKSSQGNAAVGVAVDEICVLSTALSGEMVASVRENGMDGALKRFAQLNFTFDGANDVQPIPGTSERTAHDTSSGAIMQGGNMLSMSPGAPSISSGVIPMDGDVAPVVYYENDPSRTGYNPNEEHAFLRQGPSGYVAYALRTDLNEFGASEPFVLTMYNDGGKGAMKLFSVSFTNDVHSKTESELTVGNLLSGPHPLDYVEGYYNEKNFCLSESNPTNSLLQVVYRDKYNRMWARRDGACCQYNYYPVQDGFYFPSLSANGQPEPDSLVGWMSCEGISAPTKDDIVDGLPHPWKWICSWPADDTIPSMKVGQTLTKAENGLPEVWDASSMAVVYPAPNDPEIIPRGKYIATMVDPTVAQSAPLRIDSDFPGEYAFTLGSTGTTSLKSGKYYFKGLPPSISDRFCIDPNAAEERRMVLIGKLVEKNSGSDYLQLNVLTSVERQALKDICKATGDAKTRWDEGVSALATSTVEPSPTGTNVVEVIVKSGGSTVTISDVRVAAKYTPVDHYGLVATGAGAGYVTIIENDSPDTAMVPEGSPISMHVIKVLPELYSGGLIVIEDPNNKLSEQLTIAYASPFSCDATNYVFEYRKCLPPADGMVPSDYGSWEVKESGNGLLSILLGANGGGLSELVNTYYAMRYRATTGDAYETTGGAWSGWCGPTLAEGWVQRVLKNVTPFAQRISDFYSSAAELSLTMPEQIGRPYRGDVALNNENLESVGLLELYQTVLNKAESLSLTLGVNDPSCNKQLLEAVSRLADLYALLGAEAYSDAKNPTVATAGVEAGASAVYCFANQVPSLMDEELALLRGRSSAVAPNMTTYPYYNRLIWNFTTGITEGEMAYVNNYNIMGNGGVITVEQAAAQFPQGHGDAYGHYLSAIYGYYRLLRNPCFSWGDPSMMEMLVGDSIVNMDYEDEQKFADIAAKLAQTGADVVDLTARKSWGDSGGGAMSGYLDSNSEQNFGYGEWGIRTSLGALYNWATVNYLLPDSSTNSVSYFNDNSIADIDRSTVQALRYLADSCGYVQAQVDKIDQGLNPLGLSNNAIPFDLDYRQYTQSQVSQFDQFLERTKVALENASKTLAYANKYGSRIRQIEDAAGDYAHEFETMERSYNNDLIAIYGYPYADDIGPSGTYDQGYDGPDIYHYMWMDLSEFGVTNLNPHISTNIVLYAMKGSGLPYLYSDLTAVTGSVREVRLDITSGGVILKPDRIAGKRRAEGELQAAYRDYLAAYVKYQHQLSSYGSLVNKLKGIETDIAKMEFGNAQTVLSMAEILNVSKLVLSGVRLGYDISDVIASKAEKVLSDVTKTITRSAPAIVGAGMTVNMDPRSVVSGITLASKTTVSAGISAAKATAEIVKLSMEYAAMAESLVFDSIKSGLDYYSSQVEIYDRYISAVNAVVSSANGLQDAIAELANAQQAYRSIQAEGERLLEEREMVRKQQSNSATALRYNDMYCRVQRNAALSKYSTAFDLAQKYVFILANIYDYETGLLSSDTQAGDAFMREIVSTRALGEPGLAVVPSCSDGGLYDIVARMSANWNVLKARLGATNQEEQQKEFSLRYSLFRISPDATGDYAWQQELKKYWVDDIMSNDEFRRYCQPQASEAGMAAKEPGLIIPFSTAVNAAQNFFGRPLCGGEAAYSSSDYATKIVGVDISFDDYNAQVNGYAGMPALATHPNVYLVPVGNDYMRSPSGDKRDVLKFKVVDQVLPLPYKIGSSDLDDDSWVATFSGLDGDVDSVAKIRRHSTIATGDTSHSTRLLGRSVWNDRWLLVIPASSLLSDREKGLRTFISGADLNGDGVMDQPGVSDIRIRLSTRSRSGN